MSLSSNKAFDKYKQIVEKRNAANANTKSSDERLIQFKPDNTYRVRLLYYTDKSIEREAPFIEQRIHSVWDEESRRLGKVICPTSNYVNDKAGFDMCPVCRNNSKLWKEHKAGSQTSHELYKKFKRKFYGYSLAYVVNDSFNAENNGKVMILRYGVGISDFFKKEILGEGDDKADPVGSTAFDLEDGYDLIITVSKNPTEFGVFNSYECKFARDKSSINADAKKLETEITALDFDKDFYTLSTKEEIQEFYQDFVLDSVAPDTAEVEEDIKNAETVADTPSEVVEEAPAEAKEAEKEPEAKDAGEYDIKSILEDIDKDYTK